MQPDTTEKLRYGVVVTVELIRVREGLKFLGTGPGPEAVPLLGAFKQSYILGDDPLDSNGRVRSRIGEDVTHILHRLGNEAEVWKREVQNEPEPG